MWNGDPCLWIEDEKILLVQPLCLFYFRKSIKAFNFRKKFLSPVKRVLCFRCDLNRFELNLCNTTKYAQHECFIDASSPHWIRLIYFVVQSIRKQEGKRRGLAQLVFHIWQQHRQRIVAIMISCVDTKTSSMGNLDTCENHCVACCFSEPQCSSSDIVHPYSKGFVELL